MGINLLLLHPTDLLGPKVGGDKTFLIGLIKYAPKDFNIEFIGVSSDLKRKHKKKWINICIGNKSINYIPIFFEKNENKKTKIPISLRFYLALKFTRINTTNRVLLFNRMETALIFKRSKSPKILVEQTDIEEQLQKKKGEILWRKIPRIYYIVGDYAIKSVNHVYAVCGNTLNIYKIKYPNTQNKFSLLPNWADPDIFYPSNRLKTYEREELNSIYKSSSVKSNWILFVGRLQKVKAPIRLLDSFFKYYKKDRFSCLIIVGEGNMRAKMINHVKKLNIEKNVIFLGVIKHERLASLYRASDVLLLTSNYEAMPGCVLEALGCGLPVVSTNVGEVNKVVKNGYSGELTPSFSTESISNSLEKVLSNNYLYTKKNCVDTISGYTPQKVLAPLYETIRKLHNK